MLATCRAQTQRVLFDTFVAGERREVTADVTCSKRWTSIQLAAGGAGRPARSFVPHRHYSVIAPADIHAPAPPLEQPVEDAFPDSPTSPSSPPLFQIPPSTLQHARAHRLYWNWRMFKHVNTGLPPLRHYCRTKEQSELIAQKFIEDGSRLLGFDLEWAPSNRQYRDAGLNAKGNCSMLQLANEGRIAIFHFATFHESSPETIFPPTLAHLLTSRLITKLGVHISADMTRLSRYFPHILPRSYFELSHLYKAVKYHDEPELINRRTVALAELVRDVYGLEMSKDDNVRASDWSRLAGTEQVNYAASDAYAGIMLFRELDARRRELGVEMPPCVDSGRRWGGRTKKSVSVGVRKAGKEAVVEVPVEVEQEQEQEDDIQDDQIAPEVEMDEMPEGTERAVQAEPAAQAQSKKDKRTPKEKAAALARRNAYLRSMYEKKSR